MLIDASDYEIKKALVGISIETSLMEMGRPVLDEVCHRLEKEYNCYFPDCYDHPEYLSKILKDLYGKAHLKIIKLINKNLEEFEDQKPIKQFLVKIQ